jgi:hypothetical protein
MGLQGLRRVEKRKNAPKVSCSSKVFKRRFCAVSSMNVAKRSRLMSIEAQGQFWWRFGGGFDGHHHRSVGRLRRLPLQIS